MLVFPSISHCVNAENLFNNSKTTTTITTTQCRCIYNSGQYKAQCVHFEDAAIPSFQQQISPNVADMQHRLGRKIQQHDHLHETMQNQELC